MLEPRRLYNIAHPLIDSIYLKKEFGTDESSEGKDVLVIRTIKGFHLPEEESEKLLLSFLADLDLIRDEVERKAGPFTRIDIN